MPLPSCCIWNQHFEPSFSIICIDLCAVHHQSHLLLPRISPVARDECTRTNIGSSVPHSPFIKAMCSRPLLFWRRISLKCPYSVGMSTSVPTSMSDSLCNRYAIISLMDMTLSPNSSAILSSCGRRAIVPSSFMISIRAPAGYKPAKLHKSMVASVCPLRRNLRSPGHKGILWPGRPNVCGVDVGSASALIVSARSCRNSSGAAFQFIYGDGERRTQQTCYQSLDEANPVRRISKSWLAHRVLPRACFSMKFTFSGVIFSADIIRSPSFSRSSSSTTITNFPSLKSLQHLQCCEVWILPYLNLQLYIHLLYKWHYLSAISFILLMILLSIWWCCQVSKQP